MALRILLYLGGPQIIVTIIRQKILVVNKKIMARILIIIILIALVMILVLSIVIVDVILIVVILVITIRICNFHKRIIIVIEI